MLSGVVGNHEASKVLFAGLALFLLEVLFLLFRSLIQILDGTKGSTFGADPNVKGPLSPDQPQRPT